MIVVFDTNVLISAFLTSTGPSSYVVKIAFKKFEVITSEYILEETRQKLLGKLKFPKEAVDAFEAFLRKQTTVFDIKTDSAIIFEDKKDIPILSLIRLKRPHYFVTGDQKLLNLKKFDTTLILSPREAMEAFHSSSKY